MTDKGQERSGRDVFGWVIEAGERAAGEVLVTSIDREETRKGFDVGLVDAVTKIASTPIVASGRMGAVSDFVTLAWSTVLRD